MVVLGDGEHALDDEHPVLDDEHPVLADDAAQIWGYGDDAQGLVQIDLAVVDDGP